MSDKTSIPLEVHTLQTLCNELVSGRHIAIDGDGNTFALEDSNTRALFNWYRSNTNKWSGNVLKTDVEALVDSLDRTPPELPLTQVSSQKSGGRSIRITEMRVHNFGGIQMFSDPSSLAGEFVHVFDPKLSLLEGVNGSGKTSILSAVSWALTGHIFRSQRPPEEIAEQVPVQLVDDVAGEEGHSITQITPLPPAEFLRALADKAVPLDTWVEVGLSDSDGKPIGVVRRTLTRNSRGKLTISCTDMSFLGLDPIALEVGIRMPGLIPYIKLGEGSDLGKAVATLTGIQPLEQLAAHARKAKEKLTGELVKDRQREINEIDEQYSMARRELITLFDEHSAIKPKAEVPLPNGEKGIEEKLKAIKVELESSQANAFNEARNILGETFDPQDSSLRKDLKDNIGAALMSIEAKSLANLRSERQLNALKCLTDEEITGAEDSVTNFLTEAQELATISAKPNVAARMRLYARIAGWVKSTGKQGHEISECPVCSSSLSGKEDPETQRLIQEHIQELIETDKSFLEKALAGWSKDAAQTFKAGLCQTLQAVTHDNLPTLPSNLIRSTLEVDLFEATCFQKSLSPLKSASRALCDLHLGMLPTFTEPILPTLPKEFGEIGREFLLAVTRVYRAIAFCRWCKDYASEIEGSIQKIVGNRVGLIPDERRSTISARMDQWSLTDRLCALDRMVSNAMPVTDALGKADSLSKEIAKRRIKENRIALYRIASVALEKITQLNVLVERQVLSLMNTLGARTQYWRDRFYVAAHVDAPSFESSSIDVKGAISIYVKSAGTKVPAQHISNTSDLRATLLAFLIAFWEHLLATRGALSTILLDDVQELFDPDNRRRLASAIPDVAERGAQLVLATNAPDFARKTLSAAQSKAVPSSHLEIHSVNGVRRHIVLGLFEEELDRKRNMFESPEKQNNHQSARDYLKDARIYLEDRLTDLFEIRAPGLPAAPTFADLINAVRERRRQGHDVFGRRVFEAFLNDPVLKPKSDFVELINQSHHKDERLITFNAVWKVRDDLQRVRRLLDAAVYEYHLWMRRDKAAVVPILRPMPVASPEPKFSAPLLLKLAAFAGNVASVDNVDTYERLEGNRFSNIAAYYLKTQNFGFAGAGNVRALVSVDKDAEVSDNSLVIAIAHGGVYARRLLKNQSDLAIVALSSEVEDPRRRPPSLFLPIESTRLLPVIGIVFDDRPNYERNANEAVQEASVRLLEQVEVAFRVDGDSALPLALPGQVVLGGKRIEADQLDGLQGTIVAIATSDGEGFLKRIGASVPGLGYVRQFEAIGGRGSSLLVKTEAVEDALIGVPIMISCRQVLGILY